MKVQACKFARVSKNRNVILRSKVKWEDGIAFLADNGGFDSGNVKFIVDTKGNRVENDNLYDYHLQKYPMCYLDTDYVG